MATSGPLTSHFYKWRVLFDPNNQPRFSFPDGLKVNVDSTLAVIAIHLVTECEANGAKFLTTPLDWEDENGDPAPTPPCMIVERTSDHDIVILDFNTKPGRFNFAVSLSYQGKNYTSQDPAIINKDSGPVPMEMPRVARAQAAAS